MFVVVPSSMIISSGRESEIQYKHTKVEQIHLLLGVSALNSEQTARNLGGKKLITVIS
jgi:hypothetical protein